MAKPVAGGHCCGAPITVIAISTSRLRRTRTFRATLLPRMGEAPTDSP
jgi:hypothetical protein